MTEMCYASGINPSAIPGSDLDPDAVIAAANTLATDAATIRDSGADAVAEWRGLSVHYEAPEAEQLFATMNPVETKAREFGDALDGVVSALKAYAEDIRPIKASLDTVRSDAWAFRDRIASNAEWEYDQDLVDENTALVSRVNALQVQLWEAERTCANAIRALYGADPWHAMTGENDPLGYGIDEIPTDAEMPWGSEVQRKDHCPKSAAVGVKRFVWDGVIVDGLWGTVTGLGQLVGIDGTGWHWETMKNSWIGMGSLIGYADGEWSWGNAGNAWLGLGKGLIAWDTWEDDPGRAAGGAVFNIATIFIPAGAAVSGTKGAATAAGTASRTATWLAKGARIVDMVDPVWLTVQGVKITLPKLGDMAASIRLLTEGIDDAIRLPDIPSTGLDLPTGGLDDLADGAPPVRTPEDAPLGSGLDDVEAPPVREPVTVGGGGDELSNPGGGADTPASQNPGSQTPGSQTPGGSGTPDGTPGGSGHGADDLVQTPGSGTPGSGGTDTPGSTTTPGGSTTPNGSTTPGGSTTPDAPGGNGPGTGVPGSGLADDLPTGGADDLPTGGADDVPVNGADDLPGGAADDVPAGAADDLPTGATDDLPGSAADDLPTGGADDLPSGAADDVPGSGAGDDTPAAPPPSTDPSAPGTSAGDEPGRVAIDSDGAPHVVNMSDDLVRHQGSFNEVLTSVLDSHGLTRARFHDLLATPPELLTRAQVDTLIEIRDAMPGLTDETVLQKVIPPGQALGILGDDFRHLFAEPELLARVTPDTSWGPLSGFVARAADLVGATPAQLYHQLGLNYPNTPFGSATESMFTIRYAHGDAPLPSGPGADPFQNGTLRAMSAMPDSIYAIADEGVRRQAMLDWIDQHRPEASYGANKAFDADNPYRGSGFGGSGSSYAPELSYGQGKANIPEGAEMWRVRPDGTQELAAVFRDDAWFPIREQPLGTTP